MANSFSLAGYDAQVYYIDWSAEDFNAAPTAGPAIDPEQLVAVKSASVGMARERVNIKGLGRRTRRFKNVIKQEDTLSLEFGFHDDGDKNSALAKLAWDESGGSISSATTPGQAMIIIEVDVDRDGTFAMDAGDLYFVTYSAVVDKIDISGAVNDVYNMKIDFSVGQWQTPATGAPTNIDSLVALDAADTIEDFTTSGSTYAKGASFTNTDTIDAGLESWNLSINNNCIKRYDWTNAYPRMIEKGALDITGNMVLDWIHDGTDVAQDHIDEITGETSGALTFTLSTGNSIVLSGATFDSWGVDINEVALTMQSIPYTADDITSWD